jgi:hypothetical protein
MDYTLLSSHAPRYLVAEASNGKQLRTPLLWWRLAYANGSRTIALKLCASQGGWLETDYVQTGVEAQVLFGDGQDWSDGSFPLAYAHTAVGFIPVTGIAGYPVGAYEDSQSPTIYPPCVFGSFVGKRVEEFAILTWWQKNRAAVGIVEAQTAAYSGTPLPETLPAVTAPPLPILQFRRDYLVREQAQFGDLGLEPPVPHLITLD